MVHKFRVQARKFRNRILRQIIAYDSYDKLKNLALNQTNQIDKLLMQTFFIKSNLDNVFKGACQSLRWFLGVE